MQQNDNRPQEVGQDQETTDTGRICALERCGKPARRMSRFCSADHNVASANRGGDL